MTFINNLDWRFAAKSFDPQKSVSDVDLETIKEAISKTPTSFGLEPYHVKVITADDLKEKIKPVSWDQPQITTCSHLLVFCYRTDIVDDRINAYVENATGGNEAGKAAMEGYRQLMHDNISQRDVPVWASRQTYIALGFAMAACAELQVDSCPIEGFDPAAVDAILDLPEHLKSVVLLPIGYRSEDPNRPKVRFPKDEIFS